MTFFVDLFMRSVTIEKVTTMTQNTIYMTLNTIFSVLTRLEDNSPPTLTGVGHQCTVCTNTGCNRWLSLAKPTLKVAHAGRNRSLMTRTSMCGRAISKTKT